MRSTFTIEYRTVWGESLSLVSQGRKYPMSYGDGGIWSVTIPRCTAAFTQDYGYVVMRDSLVVRTEWDRHHRTPAAEIRDAWIDCPIQGCPFPRRHSAEIFDRPGIRLAGTAVPVFSLRSADDFGVGEFGDIKLLADWPPSPGSASSSCFRSTTRHDTEAGATLTRTTLSQVLPCTRYTSTCRRPVS